MDNFYLKRDCLASPSFHKDTFTEISVLNFGFLHELLTLRGESDRFLRFILAGCFSWELQPWTWNWLGQLGSGVCLRHLYILTALCSFLFSQRRLKSLFENIVLNHYRITDCIPFNGFSYHFENEMIENDGFVAQNSKIPQVAQKEVI